MSTVYSNFNRQNASSPAVAYVYGQLSGTALPGSVDLGGTAVTGTTTVGTDSNGYFAYSITTNGAGTITVKDHAGGSNIVTLHVGAPTPIIESFACWENRGICVLQGRIIAAADSGLSVTADNGHTLSNTPIALKLGNTVYYAFKMDLVNDPGSLVTLTVTDTWGQTATATDAIPN